MEALDALLTSLLSTVDLCQSVSQPTHRSGNILDLIITRSDAVPTSCLVNPPDMISDHRVVKHYSNKFLESDYTRVPTAALLPVVSPSYSYISSQGRI